MRRWITLLFALALLMPVQARSQQENVYHAEPLYKIYDEQGKYLTSRAGEVYVDDEYIASDNGLYRIVSVEEGRATARYMGQESAGDVMSVVQAGAQGEGQPKRIAMYSTHSDESYQPSDGASSKMENAGIYDVGEALKENLEKKGIEVTYSQETFHPHDAGAYRRSRATAQQLLTQAPAALFDLHRDGIPDPDEYEKQVEGEDITMVRLLVGRSNPNTQANRAFARQIKATADEKYPGLIKDIYIGRGNYNQELYPKSLLLEFGTHTTSKEKAIKSTEYMADVIDEVLFGPGAEANQARQQKAGGQGIIWLIVGAAGIALLYVLLSSGSLKNLGQKAGRGVSQLTGGLLGKKPPKDK